MASATPQAAARLAASAAVILRENSVKDRTRNYPQRLKPDFHMLLLARLKVVPSRCD
jgi:hypothetical protein